MKFSMLTAALTGLVIGTSVQASPLTNDELFERFGEESYLSDHASSKVDMASMTIRSTHRSNVEQGISLTALHNILGEETYPAQHSLPKADMASMDIRNMRSALPERGISLNAVHNILGEESY